MQKIIVGLERHAPLPNQQENYIIDEYIWQQDCKIETNENEMNHSTARIANLWQRFYANVFSTLPKEEKIYGIYTNYESDYSSVSLDLKDHRSYGNAAQAVEPLLITTGNVATEDKDVELLQTVSAIGLIYDIEMRGTFRSCKAGIC